MNILAVSKNVKFYRKGGILFSAFISDRKKTKTFEQPSSPVPEEPEPVSCVLQGDEIQALAIKLEDLKKVGIQH